MKDYPIMTGMSLDELNKSIEEEKKRCAEMTDWEDVDEYISDEEYEAFGTEENDKM